MPEEPLIIGKSVEKESQVTGNSIEENAEIEYSRKKRDISDKSETIDDQRLELNRDEDKVKPDKRVIWDSMKGFTEHGIRGTFT